ncbi:hypothetical protein [Nitratidesulfovibrio sp. SRB-5]|uniref:hypothetical protein n=1 Tax=Nitratidesulfovibrio sp. SRB-5 TaxID=2872636 RepID=UPI0010255CE3|nr:hypothetical protein [Nitratidesulfovibrio sp. SRB-5]MBZ2171568.1 hypothetical protein [Nitratidesulfovibrio sp. SRB-5]RXF76179.1 hypothetical protein EKK70_13110 [Desulfovibrio sp. DS-1]
MKFTAKVDNTPVTFTNFSYSAETGVFSSDTNNAMGVRLNINTPLNLDTSFNNKEFSVFPIVKRGLAENEIFQVYDKSRDTRIGWCIPINALCSTEHDFAANTHFLKYAHAGIKHLLNAPNEDIHTKHPQVTDETPLYLSEFFDESVALFVVSNETLRETPFDIGRWLPGLAKYGFFKLTQFSPKLVSITCDTITQTHISISPISNAIDEISQISSIYTNALPYEKNIAFQFFYLYQTIEMLMEIIFKNEQGKFITQLINAQGDVHKTKDLIQNSGINTSEKRRLCMLAQSYCKCEDTLHSMISLCNNLLNELDIETGTSLETTLYPVRNFIVHRFRSFPNDATEHLKNVTNCFLDLAHTLLARFKIPAAP